MGAIDVIDIVVSYMFKGKLRESTVSFGRITDKILGSDQDTLCADDLVELWLQRDPQKWRVVFYTHAMEVCRDWYFRIGFIPPDLQPRRFVPASDVISARFPDGRVMYRKEIDCGSC